MVVKIIFWIFIVIVLLVAFCFLVSYLKSKFATWEEYRGTVVSISNYTMVINCFEPGMYALVLVEDEHKVMHQYTTNLNIAERLIVNHEYNFIECDGVLVDVVAVN